MINGIDILLIVLIIVLAAENKRQKNRAENWKMTAKIINTKLNSK
jgi:hypothetical protein